MIFCVMLPDDMISLKNCSRSAVQITFCGAVVTLDFFFFTPSALNFTFCAKK